MKALIPEEIIERKIYLIRGHRVMLAGDLAKLYGVSTKRLNEQVKRNMRRFPSDFMFQLTLQEEKILKLQFTVSNSRSQFATLKQGQNIKYLSYAFTEQGVAMLSSVLNSEMSILVNIQIMRTFVNLRRIAVTYSGLKRKIEDMEKKYDSQFSVVFEAIRKLIEPPEKPRRMIGFHSNK